MGVGRVPFSKKSLKIKKSYGTVSFANGMGDLVSHLVSYLKPKIKIQTGVSLSSISQMENLKGSVRICISLKNLVPILGNSLNPEETPNLLTISTITRFGETRLTKKPCFGVLFGKEEGVRALGVLCNSDIFDGRVKDSSHSETWIYPKLDGFSSEKEIEFILESDRAMITKKKEKRQKAIYKTTWEGVFPAYDRNLFLCNQKFDQMETNWKKNRIGHSIFR